MSKKTKAYVSALPADALPELQELLKRYSGGESNRGNVVMMRLADDALEKLDQLVEAGLFSSRSESAAFLIGCGLEAQAALFSRIEKHTKQIQKLRSELHTAAVEALQSTAPQFWKNKPAPKTE